MAIVHAHHWGRVTRIGLVVRVGRGFDWGRIEQLQQKLESALVKMIKLNSVVHLLLLADDCSAARPARVWCVCDVM